MEHIGGSTRNPLNAIVDRTRTEAACAVAAASRCRECRASGGSKRSLLNEVMLPRAIRLAVVLLSFAVPAFAQVASGHFDHPVFLVGGQYGTPTGLAGTAGLLIAPPGPFKAGGSPDSSRVGLVLAGGAGTGGFRVAAGGAALALEGPFLTTGFDALFTLTRTREMPRGAAGESTYVGGEAGLVIMSVRLSAGVAHRTARTRVPKATIFTWSVGVQIPLGW